MDLPQSLQSLSLTGNPRRGVSQGQEPSQPDNGAETINVAESSNDAETTDPEDIDHPDDFDDTTSDEDDELSEARLAVWWAQHDEAHQKMVERHAEERELMRLQQDQDHGQRIQQQTHDYNRATMLPMPEQVQRFAELREKNTRVVQETLERWNQAWDQMLSRQAEELNQLMHQRQQEFEEMLHHYREQQMQLLQDEFEQLANARLVGR
ncbi:uncharacterized protein A1O5_13044 [Cladophialophora psammophila CBS 110553]|uniref:Uncharacterized protein n=1 Tax=Cladophialophora psammophila CBS 110553 TaxID=1182543 RepID=W9W543_9EURO|nr:uncharacterized protein A1O5_13044 [Cladophialophora psammophila CBS 110553]EXJ53689.1 hypothetical protein A1O5_13044 [Cladophialophora psammophila CBS 110553]